MKKEMKSEQILQEQAFDMLLEYAAEAASEELLEEPLPEETVDFSDKHKKEMEELFRTLETKRTGFFYLRHIAAVLLVCAVLASASVMSVDAWRNKFLNFFTKVTETHTEIRYNKKNPAEGSYATDMVRLGYLPEGMRLVEKVERNTNAMLTFANGEQSFKLRVSRTTANAFLDTEAKESKKVDINGAEGFLRITEDGYSTLKWSTETYSYTLSGNLDIDALLKIAEHIN
ncbi:MAG: DUF4367 domain-containing protein [Clostridia bacterium]|nr:DUF4367 domain-containing protein [Clostridia bacterium]